MPGLSRILDVPVPVTLGGRPFRASAATLGDLAELELLAAQADPEASEEAFEAARDALIASSPGSDERVAAARRALEVADKEHVVLGDDRFCSYVASPEGFTWCVLRSLGRNHPGLDGVPGGTTAEELDRVLMVFFGRKRSELVRSLIPRPENNTPDDLFADLPELQDPRRDPSDLILRLCELYHMSPAEFSALTINQFWALVKADRAFDPLDVEHDFGVLVTDRVTEGPEQGGQHHDG